MLPIGIDYIQPDGGSHHREELVRQGVVVREELERRGGRQGGGRLVVGVAEASADRELLSQNVHLVFDPL